MKCPNCKIHDLVVIRMKIRAEPVVLRTCSSCGCRDWEGLDGSMPLRSVLALVGTR
jgi:hypothetical protein